MTCDSCKASVGNCGTCRECYSKLKIWVAKLRTAVNAVWDYRRAKIASDCAVQDKYWQEIYEALMDLEKK